jgi:hypothetical protein
MGELSASISPVDMNDTARHPEDFASSFEAAFARLQIRIEHACLGESPSDWPAQVAAAIEVTLAFAAADPAAAQVLTNEAMAEGKTGFARMAEGKTGFARYDRMIDHFAACLRRGRAQRAEGEWLPEITEKAMVGGLAMLIAQRLDMGREAELPSLAPEAIQFVLTPYLGTEHARRVAASAEA